MTVILRHHRAKLLLVFVLVFCFGMAAGVMAAQLKDDLHIGITDDPFSVLILGDSQMAGNGWDGGYANCIRETYKDTQVINLAQSGSILANGDMHAQWEYYLSEDCPMTDYVLLDGGCNDLFYLLRKELQDTGLTLVKDAFSSLVEQIHAVNPAARIVYILMPPLVEWKDSESGPPAYEIQERFWKEMNMLASTYDYVTVLDLFSLNPFHFPCVDCYHKYFADSIHLSEAGYRKSFEYIGNIFTAQYARELNE